MWMVVGILTALVGVQGIVGGWLLAAVAVALCLAAWRVPLLRHGVGSFAAGGAGMALGSLIDTPLGLGASCHDSGLWSVSTLGMVIGCTAACITVCRMGGASGLNPVFHVVTLIGMFAGEASAAALVVLLGSTPGHWTLTAGMALGAAVGAATAALAQQGGDRRAAPRDIGDAGLVELGEHGLLGASERSGESTATV